DLDVARPAGQRGRVDGRDPARDLALLAVADEDAVAGTEVVAPVDHADGEQAGAARAQRRHRTVVDPHAARGLLPVAEPELERRFRTGLGREARAGGATVEERREVGRGGDDRLDAAGRREPGRGHLALDAAA